MYKFSPHTPVYNRRPTHQDEKLTRKSINVCLFLKFAQKQKSYGFDLWEFAQKSKYRFGDLWEFTQKQKYRSAELWEFTQKQKYRSAELWEFAQKQKSYGFGFWEFAQSKKSFQALGVCPKENFILSFGSLPKGKNHFGRWAFSGSKRKTTGRILKSMTGRKKMK